MLSGQKPEGLEAPRRKGRVRLGMIAAAAFGLAGLALVAFLATLQLGQNASIAGTADGIGETIAAGPAAGRASAPAGAPADAGEDQVFARARETPTRQAYQDSLIASPNGAYAQRVRDMLLTCRTEERDTWEPGQAGQVYRGVNGDDLIPTEAPACNTARGLARATAETSCRAISSTVGYRNGRVETMDEGPCSCTATPGGTFCIADPSYRCNWEARVVRPVEVCG